MKRCGSCQIELPPNSFWKHKPAKDGLASNCKDCEKYYKRERNAIRPLLQYKTSEEIAQARRDFKVADQARIRKELEGNAGQKVCNTCYIEKPHDAFYKSTRSRDGRQAKCIDCERKYVSENQAKIAERATNYERDNKKKIDEKRAARRAADPEKHRRASVNRTLKHMYGITLDERDAILAQQGGICAICGVPEEGSGKRFCVDHDHITGAVRGILCINCNTGIGNLQDNLDIVKHAVSYLERHQAVV